MKNYQEMIVRQLAQHLISCEFDDYESKIKLLDLEGEIGNQYQIRSLVEEYLTEHQA